jgi:small-conductance mechanosensitive channel
LKLVREVLEKTTGDVTWRDKAYPPRVLLLNFGDSAVIYETSAWMHEPFNYRIAASDLREAIWLAFRRAGIVIALPQMDVHLAEQVGSGISAALGGSGQRRP